MRIISCQSDDHGKPATAVWEEIRRHPLRHHRRPLGGLRVRRGTGGRRWANEHISHKRTDKNGAGEPKTGAWNFPRLGNFPRVMGGRGCRCRILDLGPVDHHRHSNSAQPRRAARAESNHKTPVMQPGMKNAAMKMRPAPMLRRAKGRGCTKALAKRPDPSYTTHGSELHDPW